MSASSELDQQQPELPLCRCVMWWCFLIWSFPVRGTTQIHQGAGNGHGGWQEHPPRAQKSAAKDEPSAEDLYEIGCMANILQMLKLPDGTIKVLVEGVQRTHRFGRGSAYPFHGHSTLVPVDEGDHNETEAMRRAIIAQFDQYVKLNKKIPPEILTSLSASTTRAASPIRSPPICRSSSKKAGRAGAFRHRRPAGTAAYATRNRTRHPSGREAHSWPRQAPDGKSQREYYLNEQVKAIQKELGEGEDGADLEEMEKKIKASGMPKEALAKAQAELKKLRLMSPMSAEATVVPNYIDTLIGLPRKRAPYLRTSPRPSRCSTRTTTASKRSRSASSSTSRCSSASTSSRPDPLSVRRASGVGKTSLGQSIARATNRKFVRMSLGGVRDEAEIRGHRRTYIGSMPGKILQNMHKIGVRNPLFLLDEVDKMGPISVATPRPRCSRCWIRSRTRPLSITTSRSSTICPTSCSWLPQTR